MTLGSLFSGIGGFDAAAERCGMTVAWQVEVDRFARRVLKRHWPGVERHGDVRTVDPGGLERVDILCAGFPCQDLSVAGARAGLSGERSGLFREVVRFARVLRPAWVVLENVPGLLSSWSPVEPPPGAVDADMWDVEETSDFETVLAALRELGYLGAWRVLDAQYFDLAQRRERPFVVGCLGAERLSALLPLLESGSRDLAPRRTAREDLAGSLGSGPGGRGWSDDTDRMTFVARPLLGKQNSSHDESKETYVAVAGSQTARYGSSLSVLDAEEGNFITHTLRADGFDASEDGTGRGTPVIAFNANDQGNDATEGLSPTLRCGGLNGGGVHTAVAILQESQTGVRLYENAGALRADAPGTQPTGSLVAFGIGENSRGEVLESEVSRCVTAGGGKPIFGYPAARTGTSVRRLTPTECERLQGFPDGWTCLCGRNAGRSWPEEHACRCPDGPRYRALGNAVAVPVAAWVLRRVLEASQ
jgi:DNA (cytosine-5)-methyltransferase 1